MEDASAPAAAATTTVNAAASATVDLVSDEPEDVSASKKRRKDKKKKKKKKKKGSPASRRLLKDFKKMRSDPPTGINAVPINNNILTWQAVIFGYLLTNSQHLLRTLNALIVSVSKLLRTYPKPCSPDESVWESGMFKLRLEFTEEYPNKPPKVRASTLVTISVAYCTVSLKHMCHSFFVKT